ncbi:MAG: NUDIX hydrolase [Chloroflexales bacterium]|nr:NUDIX hydrolase [Chloroflexales bacterium]
MKQLPTTLAERQDHLRALLEQLIAAAPSESGQPGQALRLDADADPDTLAYITALLDLLRGLGVITSGDGGGWRVASIAAGYFLRMLYALLDSAEPLVADWNKEGLSTPSPAHPFGSGVNLLAALERRRLELHPAAQPLREVHAVVGLIGKRLPSGERAFLLHWDIHAQQWQLIGGRREHSDVSPRATLLREIAEELGCPPVVEGRHVLLRELGEPFAEEHLSSTFGLLSRITFQAYAVRFLSDLPSLSPDLRWISEAELLAGRNSAGQTIAVRPFRRVAELIEEGDVFGE